MEEVNLNECFNMESINNVILLYISSEECTTHAYIR